MGKTPVGAMVSDPEGLTPAPALTTRAASWRGWSASRSWPAWPAASCSSWRNSSRFSWIEAITGPGRHAEADQRRFRELQAGLDGLRHRVGDADRIEMAGVRRRRGRATRSAMSGRSARTTLHDLVDGRLVVDGDDHGRAPPSGRSSSGTPGWRRRRSRPRGRAGASSATAAGSRSVAMNGKLCRSSMRADDLPDAAVADDDGVSLLAGRRHRGQLRRRAACGARARVGDAPRGNAPAAGSAPW